MTTTYKAISSRHPHGRTRSYLFSVYLVQPLAACMLPVMIGALITMLEGYRVLQYLYIGFPLAVVVAAAWTSIFVQKHVAEIHVRPDAIGIRSVWEAATPKKDFTWLKLLDLDESATAIKLTAAYEIHTIHRSEWPEYNDLKETLTDLLESTRYGDSS